MCGPEIGKECWGKAEEDVENILEFTDTIWLLGETYLGERRNENKVARMLTLAEMKALRKECKRIEVWEWVKGLCVGSKVLWESMAFTGEM